MLSRAVPLARPIAKHAHTSLEINFARVVSVQVSKEFGEVRNLDSFWRYDGFANALECLERARLSLDVKYDISSN